MRIEPVPALEGHVGVPGDKSVSHRAVLVAALLFLAMIPMFLGLLVVLPVLGHATWHLYRRCVR